MEALDVLLRPDKYERLGARCPRGMLFAGPPGAPAALRRLPPCQRCASLTSATHSPIVCAHIPGTGKTLLARAVAGTARLPFLCCSGSDFVEVTRTQNLHILTSHLLYFVEAFVFHSIRVLPNSF